MAMHMLKIESRFFKKILTKEKRAEFRRNDRKFQLCDTLILQEVILTRSKEKFEFEFTGREIACAVTDITFVNDLYDELSGLPEFVMLSFQVIEERKSHEK